MLHSLSYGCREIIQSIIQIYSAGKWENNKKYVRKYDSDGNLLMKTTKHWFKWKWFPPFWFPIRKEIYEYKRPQFIV